MWKEAHLLALYGGVSHWPSLRVGGARIISALYCVITDTQRDPGATQPSLSSPSPASGQEDGPQWVETIACRIPINLPSWLWEGSRKAYGPSTAALGELWDWLSCLPLQREPYGCFDSTHQMISGDLEIWGVEPLGNEPKKECLPGSQHWVRPPFNSVDNRVTQRVWSCLRQPHRDSLSRNLQVCATARNSNMHGTLPGRTLF